MTVRKTTKTSRGWSPVDAENLSLYEKAGVSLLSLYNITSPAKIIISNVFFGGSDFLWCTEGAVRFEFSDREDLVLREGEFLVIFSSRIVTMVGLERNNTLRGGLLVGRDCEDFLLKMGFYDCFVCRNPCPDYTMVTLQEQLERRLAGDPNADFALLHYTHFILQSIVAALSTGRDAVFYEAVKRINANFLDGIASVKFLYAEMNCSPPYLIRIFKEHGLHGPSEYLYRLQSWWACRLLTRTRQTIREIAQACGFSSSSSFTRFFRHWMGVSPADVRNGKPYRRPGVSPNRE